MNKRIVLLLNWTSNEKSWIVEELERLGHQLTVFDIHRYNDKNHVVKWGKIIIYWQYLILAFKAVFLTKEDDIIVSWCFTTGVLTSFFSWVFHKKRKVIALNLIAYEKSSIANPVKSYIFRKAFLSQGMVATTNSDQYFEIYDRMFKLGGKKVLWVLHDSFGKSVDFHQPEIDTGSFCFSGGEAERDWKTLLEAAKKCEGIAFKVVARKMRWDYSLNVPFNVDILFDQSIDSFYSFVRKSKFVVLPLSSKITCGLIVFIASIKEGKMVIVTDTPAIRAYIPGGCEDILVPMYDSDILAKKILFFWDNDEKRLRITKQLQKHLIDNFSSAAYAKRIDEILHECGFLCS